MAYTVVHMPWKSDSRIIAYLEEVNDLVQAIICI